MVKYRMLFVTGMMLFTFCAQSQEIDSIFFHLYTDSLKKGTYNYINVDARLRNGRWYPLTDKQLIFSTTGGTFDGSSLFLDTGFSEEKVTVTAVLRADTAINKSVVIFIKKQESTERLKTKEEVMQEIETPKQRKKKNS